MGNYTALGNNFTDARAKTIALAAHILAVSLISLSLAACAGTDLVSKLSFPPPQNDFGDYRDSVRSHLLQQRMPHRSEQDVELNLPFELSADKSKPYLGKFLLIHGLSDSAYVWRDIASFLSRSGYDVRAVLLPGHGSTPEKMLDVHYQDWLRASRQHLAAWHTDNTPIYLGGFSLGAVISTILSLENKNIAGLLLVSPAFESKLNYLLRWSWIYKRFKPWMFGGMILEDNPIKYNSIPINSGDQYFRTTRYLKRRWNNRTLSIPVLGITTLNDSVVNVDYTRELFKKRFTSEKTELILYSGSESTTAHLRETIRFSEFKGKRILNQSHLSLINSPQNPLMGENGPLLVCNGNDYTTFFACMRATGHWFGAQHTPSPDGVAVARTTYNPDFQYLTERITAVFSQQ